MARHSASSFLLVALAFVNLLVVSSEEFLKSSVILNVNELDGANATLALTDAAAFPNGTSPLGYGLTIFSRSSTKDPTSIQVVLKTITGLNSTDIFEFSFWVKSLSTSGTGPGSFVFKTPGGQDIQTKATIEFTYSRVWQQIRYAFTTDPGVSGYSIVIYAGDKTGKILFDEFKMIKVADSSWYDSAGQEIMTWRTTQFQVLVQDDKGNPLSGANVRARLVRHEFPFGTTLNFTLDNSDVDKMAQDIAAQFFWSGEPYLDFEWPIYEPEKNKTNYKRVDSLLKWAEDQGWTPIRGKSLMWGSLDSTLGFDKFWAYEGSCEDLRNALENRIKRDLTTFKGRFQHYYVWNEPLKERVWFTKCGWTLLDKAFEWAREADPTALLLINEADVLSGDRWPTLVQFVQSLQKKSVPIAGIALEAHFNTTFIPGLVKYKLDRVAELGLPIYISEYDVALAAASLGRAAGGITLQDEVHKALTTFFAHPAVAGISVSGYLAGRTLTADGAFFNADGTWTEAAHVLQRKWQSEWVTDTAGAVTPEGVLYFSGYFGTYNLAISYTFPNGSIGQTQVLVSLPRDAMNETTVTVSGNWTLHVGPTPGPESGPTPTTWPEGVPTPVPTKTSVDGRGLPTPTPWLDVETPYQGTTFKGGSMSAGVRSSPGSISRIFVLTAVALFSAVLLLF